jgi:hypothetical protein
MEKLCKNCRFWRDKAWDGDDGIGICDNPTVIKQVSLMSEEFIKRFAKDERDACVIAGSLRFNSDFGCIHFKDEK